MVDGDGYAIASIDELGEGYGFRKIRKGLAVQELGMNAIVMPPDYETGSHYHEEQEEVYFVHRGAIQMTFGDGESHRLEEGGVARVDASTVRRVKNVGEGDAVYVVVGAKGGYVGRDGKQPEGEDRR
jgi:mannose-6-phosphate isomerase-like protein (cupin superfamily)